MMRSVILFFFFNDTATTEIYTLSLHDALPISMLGHRGRDQVGVKGRAHRLQQPLAAQELERHRVAVHQIDFVAPRLGFGHDADRKSTRLNSSHLVISYAVFCLKKKTDRLETGL